MQQQAFRYNQHVAYGETRQTQARRWAQFPAYVLFGLSLLWLVFSFFRYLGSEELRDQITYGSGVLLLVLDMLLIPVGGAVVGIYLLLRKRWAVIPAALLPLRILQDFGTDKLARTGKAFHLYNESGQLSDASNGVNHLLQLAAFLLIYGVMLVHLWRVWNLLRSRGRWSGAAATGDAGTVAASRGKADEGDVCFLLPETDDAESA
jgi:hypothetical protein